MAALQDTTALISELTSRLNELDNKVAAYRLDMAAEFTKHSEEVLRAVPGDVAYRVSQAITESLANYPSLYPPGSLSSTPSATPTPTSVRDLQLSGRASPPPVLPHTSGSPKDVASPSSQSRGSHDRDVEFHGLFTPTYLPLLEEVERPQHLAPASPGPLPTSTGPAPAVLGSAPHSSDPANPETASVDCTHFSGRATSPDISHQRRRPSPLRRGTNTSIDSTVSDTSSVRTVKSALRRLSSSSRQPDSPRDPRRVRFDFQGQQVLPSSSPQTSPIAPPEPVDKTLHLHFAPVEDETCATLGDIPGEEDDIESGAPKKVSSTQALRALSKAPLDEGTVWTIVNTESASEASSSSETDKVRRNTATNAKSQLESTEDTMDSHNTFGRPKREAYAQTRSEDEDSSGPSQPRNVHVQREKQQFEDEDDDSDDEANVLFMGSKKGGQKPHLPVSSKAASRKTVTPSAQFDTPAASPKSIPGGLDKVASATPPLPSQAGAPPVNSTNLLGEPALNAMPKPITSASPYKPMANLHGLTDTGEESSTSSSSSDNDLQPLGLRERSKRYMPGAHAAEDDGTLFEMDDDEEGGGSTKYLQDRSELRAERREKRIQRRLERQRKYDGQLPTEMTDEDLSTAETKVLDNDIPHSPPMEIAGSSSYRPKTPEFKVPNKVPRGHPGGYPASTSIGTYDGKPITPHVVKNKALRDQLKNGESDVPFFVGSVNGNSGVDASNVKSYQASVFNPSTPNGGFASGSFAERLMWEKATGVNYGSDEERWGVKKPAAADKDGKKVDRKPSDISFGSPVQGSKVKRGSKQYVDKQCGDKQYGDKQPGDKQDRNDPSDKADKKYGGSYGGYYGGSHRGSYGGSYGGA